MRKLKFTRPSSVDEHVELGIKLINQLKALEELEEEKKSVNKSYTDQINGKKEYLKILRSNLEEHKISLEVECIVIKSYKEGAWLFVDPNTSEVVHTEPFSDLDWQVSVIEDADEVIDENGDPREQKLLEGPRILQLTAGADSESSVEGS